MDETLPTTPDKELIKALSKEQLDELEKIIKARKSPTATRVKEATTIRHSNRLALVIGFITVITLESIIGWSISRGDLGWTLIMPTVTTVIFLVIFLGARSFWDTWTRPEDRRKNNEHW